MKPLQLIDRVVVEITSKDGIYESLVDVANELRHIAEQIENGMKGETYLRTNPNNEQHTEILWEHESKDYGGFRIVSDRPLIRQFIYCSEHKPRIIPDGHFPMCYITREDFDMAGFDTKSILDDDIERVASLMNEDYRKGWSISFDDDLAAAANNIGLKEKED